MEQLQKYESYVPITEAITLQKDTRRKKTPKTRIKKVDKGTKGSFSYVKSQSAIEWLEENFIVLEIKELTDSIHSHVNWLSAAVQVTVMDSLGARKTVVRYGSVEAVPSQAGKLAIPPVKAAMSDAIKRCCVALGGFRDVYGEVEAEEPVGEVDFGWYIATVLPISSSRFKDDPAKLFKQMSAYASGQITKEQLANSYHITI